MLRANTFTIPPYASCRPFEAFAGGTVGIGGDVHAAAEVTDFDGGGERHAHAAEFTDVHGGGSASVFVLHAAESLTSMAAAAPDSRRREEDEEKGFWLM